MQNTYVVDTLFWCNPEIVKGIPSFPPMVKALSAMMRRAHSGL
jgi:hypothetical protein